MVRVHITLNVITCILLSKIIFGCINARSVQNKAMVTSDFVIEKSIDVCSITEILMDQGSADQVFCSEFNPHTWI